METKEFNKLVESQIESIRNVLAKKADEYAFGDRLSNFKRAAALLRKTPETALVGMLTKHVVSILDMVDELEIPEGKTFSMKTWDEKISDSINYLILLKGLVYERYTTLRGHQQTSITEDIEAMGQLLPRDVPHRCVPREVPQPEDRRSDNEEQSDPVDRVQWPR